MTTRIFYVLLFLPILLIEGCKDESVIALGENYPKQIIIPNNRDKRPDLVPAEPQKLLVAETNTDPHKISNFLSGKSAFSIAELLSILMPIESKN